jgi:hypothetical protein
MSQKQQGSFLDQWLKKKPSVIESTTDSDAESVVMAQEVLNPTATEPDALQSNVITDNIGEAVSVSATDMQDAHCDESTSCNEMKLSVQRVTISIRFIPLRRESATDGRPEMNRNALAIPVTFIDSEHIATLSDSNYIFQ